LCAGDGMSEIAHGPKAGCNWNKCGLDKTDACPFVREDNPRVQDTVQGYCEHEWRQVSNVLDMRFYCVHCLTITSSKPEHGIVSEHNRGWTPFD
jgi:hypothetical protein